MPRTPTLIPRRGGNGIKRSDDSVVKTTVDQIVGLN